jgi:hypothetical protein
MPLRSAEALREAVRAARCWSTPAVMSRSELPIDIKLLNEHCYVDWCCEARSAENLGPPSSLPRTLAVTDRNSEMTRLLSQRSWRAL